MLTAKKIEAERTPAPGRIRKLTDGAGLYLLLTPNGKRAWRLKFRWAGKESMLSLGPYPDVGLALARDRAAAARELLKAGKNPAVQKRAERDAATVAAANTFGRAGGEYLRLKLDEKSERTRKKHEWLFHHLRKFHGRPLDAITRPEIVQLCRVLEQQGKRETAHRVMQFANAVFEYARASGYTDKNPAAGDSGKVLKPKIVESHAGIVNPKRFGELMRYIDGEQYRHSHPTVTNALRMLARVFVRPVELRTAEWAHIDFKKAEWRIPKEIMKMRRDHIVPLAPAVVAILKDQHKISGSGRYVFPQARSDRRPMSDGTMNAALKDRWYYESSDHTPHGFRSSASTLLNDSGEFDSALVELQLAHAKKDQVAAVYDRSQRLPERRAMMVRWCAMIEEFKALKQA